MCTLSIRNVDRIPDVWPAFRSSLGDFTITVISPTRKRRLRALPAARLMLCCVRNYAAEEWACPVIEGPPRLCSSLEEIAWAQRKREGGTSCISNEGFVDLVQAFARACLPCLDPIRFHWKTRHWTSAARDLDALERYIREVGSRGVRRSVHPCLAYGRGRHTGALLALKRMSSICILYIHCPCSFCVCMCVRAAGSRESAATMCVNSPRHSGFCPV